MSLAPGKRRSEIHAWLLKVSKVDNWNKVSIVPSVKFIPKIQLAKKYCDRVA